MGIKEKRHPAGAIDMTIVPLSFVVDEPIRLFVNQYMKREGIQLKKNHHILIVDMGEKE